MFFFIFFYLNAIHSFLSFNLQISNMICWKVVQKNWDFKTKDHFLTRKLLNCWHIALCGAMCLYFVTGKANLWFKNVLSSTGITTCSLVCTMIPETGTPSVQELRPKFGQTSCKNGKCNFFLNLINAYLVSSKKKLICSPYFLLKWREQRFHPLLIDCWSNYKPLQ